MKKILKQNLGLVLIFAVVFGVFGQSFAAGKQPLSNEKAVSISAVYKIQVVFANAQSQITAQDNRFSPAATNNCAISWQQNLNFIQDVPAINLNQPANCFSLSLGTVQAAQALKVQPLASAQPQIVVVALPEAVLESQNFNPSTPFVPFVPVLPFMPILAFVIIISVLIKLKSGLITRIASQQYSYQLSLHELQILRC